MKKLIAIMLLFCLFMTGCTVNVISDTAPTSNGMPETTAAAEAETAVPESNHTAQTSGYDSTKYMVEFRLKQSHFTLDLGEHLRDKMNECSFELPVDKEFYDSIDIGDEIVDDFRMGSLIMHGSFNSWKIIVKDKYTMTTD